MNTQTRRALAIGAVLFAVATLFPPWFYTYDRNGQYMAGHTRTPAGYHFVFLSPVPRAHEWSSDLPVFHGVEIDVSRLLIELIAAAGVAAATALVRFQAPRFSPRVWFSLIMVAAVAALIVIAYETRARPPNFSQYGTPIDATTPGQRVLTDREVGLTNSHLGEVVSEEEAMGRPK